MLLVYNKIYTPNVIKLGKNVPKRTNSFISRSAVTSSNIKPVDLAYSIYDNSAKTSTKPPLLVFHALFGSKKDVDHISKEINQATGRKVIAVDARNHGDSPHSPQHTYFHMVGDVMKLLKKLDFTKVSVFGHCMGGQIAMMLALTHPDLVSSVAVEDVIPGTTGDRGMPLTKLFKVFCTLRISSDVPMIKARELAHEHLKTEVKYIILRNYLVDELVKSDNDFYAFMFNVPVLKEAFLAKVFDFPNNLNGLQYTGPTLFMGGVLSDFIRNSDLPVIRKYFPSAEIYYVDGVGHGIHQQKTEKFLEILCKFLEKC